MKPQLIEALADAIHHNDHEQSTSAIVAIQQESDRVASEIVPPFSFEYIDSSIDGPNYRVADGRDDRFATCYERTHAEAVVKALNVAYPAV